MSHFPPGHKTSVILYLVPYFLEVWKYEVVWQSQYIDALFPWSQNLHHSLLSYTLIYVLCIKHSAHFLKGE